MAQKTSPRGGAPPASAEELRARLKTRDARLAAAKAAYMQRTPFDGQEVTYDDLTRIAKEYIDTSHALQKATFGAIRLRLTVAKLLR